MFEVFWFFFILQLRTVGKALGFSLLAGILLNLALEPMGLFVAVGIMAVSWPKILMSPQLNTQWLATLPVARVEMIFARVMALLSGVFLYFIAIALCGGFLSSSLAPKNDHRQSSKVIQAFAEPAPQSEKAAQPSNMDPFGGRTLYYVCVVLSFIFMAILLVAVTSLVMNPSGKLPSLSGNPWLHPSIPLRVLWWSVSLLPLLVLYISGRQSASGHVAALNLLLFVGWIVFICGMVTAMHAKLPRSSRWQWLLWLGAGHFTLAFAAIAVAWSWSRLGEIFVS